MIQFEKVSYQLREPIITARGKISNRVGYFIRIRDHDNSGEGEILPISKLRTKQTLHNVKSYHTPSSIVGKIAKISRCKKLVLTHFVPTRFNEKKLKNVVKKDYGKNPIIGKDLMKIKI